MHFQIVINLSLCRNWKFVKGISGIDVKLSGCCQSCSLRLIHLTGSALLLGTNVSRRRLDGRFFKPSIPIVRLAMLPLSRRQDQFPIDQFLFRRSAFADCIQCRTVARSAKPANSWRIFTRQARRLRRGRRLSVSAFCCSFSCGHKIRSLQGSVSRRQNRVFAEPECELIFSFWFSLSRCRRR